MERIRPIETPYQPEIAEHFAAMMPPGVEPLRLFRTLAHNPRILGKIRAGNPLDRGSLERIDRELAILRTCARCGSEYEWGVHVAVFGRRYGIAEEKLSGTVLWDWALAAALLISVMRKRSMPSRKRSMVSLPPAWEPAFRPLTVKSSSL